MNIASFVISLFAALLSFLQGGCLTSFSGLGRGLSESFGDYSSSRDFAALGGAGALVMLASILGVIGGSLALGRKKSSYVCLFISAAMCGLAFANGFKDAAIYGIAYALAGFFAMMGTSGSETQNISRQQNYYTPPTYSFNSGSEQRSTQSVSLEKRPSPTTSSSQPVSTQKKYEPVVGVETEALIERAFLFLEDGEEYEAERYIEQALNQAPKNPHVYMAKLMLDHKVSTPEELIRSLPTALEDEKLYQRALRFADEEYKSQLENYAQASRDKLEQERLAREAERERIRLAKEAEKEELYQKIMVMRSTASTVSEFEEVLRLISSLRPYKDTKELYTEVSEALYKEKDYQRALETKRNAHELEDFRSLVYKLEQLSGYKDSEELLAEAKKSLAEAEKAEQRKRKMKIILVIASLVAVIGGIFWYQKYSAEQEEQRIRQEAEAQRLEAQRQAEAQRLEAQRQAEAQRLEAQRQAEAQRLAEAQRQSYGSDYAKAEEYLNAKDYSPAFEIFRRLANDGYAPAQDKLAWMYQNGWGVEQSYTQAVSWFRKAAEQGNIEAMASMGLMYYRGWGVTQNYDTALEWYGKAAAQGSEVAQRRINSIQLLKVNKDKIATIERGQGFPIAGTIFAEKLSVRQSPNTKSRIVKSLKTGHPVSVSRVSESDNDYWFYVKTASGTEGWVLGGYVTLIDRDLSYEENRNRRQNLPAHGEVTTREDSLNLRNVPTVKGSQVVEKLDSGTPFTAYERFAGDTVDWYRIRTEYGDEGWVSGKYIELYNLSEEGFFHDKDSYTGSGSRAV